jgi:hypothetical protein
MNLRTLRWALLAYAAFDLFFGGVCGGFLPLTPLAAAQFTTVSGTIVDPNGLAYANGTIVSVLILPGGTSPTLGGLPYTPPTQPVGLDGTGSFTIQLADNTVLLPAATKWNFTVCSAIGTVLPAGGKGPVCFTLASPITISGVSQNITAQLKAAALSLGSVTPAANITVSGQGYCLLPWCVMSVINQAASTSNPGANATAAMQVVLPWATTFTKATIFVSVTSNGNHFLECIFDATGVTLIRQISLTLGAGTGALSTTFASTSLPTGTYWVLWGSDNATPAVLSAVAPGVSALALINTNTNTYGGTGNPLSGGNCPSTVGVGGLNTGVNDGFPMTKLEP